MLRPIVNETLRNLPSRHVERFQGKPNEQTFECEPYAATVIRNEADMAELTGSRFAADASSAMGATSARVQQRTSAYVLAMSAILPKADIHSRDSHVR